MRFSEHFEIERTAADDWFDCVLSADTRLSVDPFLIYGDHDPFWASAHRGLIEFFNTMMSLLARSSLQRGSAHWKAAERLVIFPEPQEFCLGYTDGSTEGSGSGAGLGANVLNGAAQAIAHGVDSVEHFEEVTLFDTGVGADRIGDVVCNVLKSTFIEYTQGVVQRHDLQTSLVPVRNANWSPELERWQDRSVSLPVNPFSGKAVLLAPERFLRDLPNVEPDGFWAYALGISDSN
jgi:hypothetical protein